MHAEVGVVDDRCMTVGSASLDARALMNDTEMNVVTDDAAPARDTRQRLWAEHRKRGGPEATHRLIGCRECRGAAAGCSGPLTGIVADS